MTDYNDGNWHGWSGEKPADVNNKSMVEMVWRFRQSIEHTTGQAEDFRWVQAPEVENIAFRVVKVHREPCDWWAFCGYIYATKAEAEVSRSKLIEMHPENRYENIPIIRVREVIE